jgi:hypothetical protein
MKRANHVPWLHSPAWMGCKLLLSPLPCGLGSQQPEGLRSLKT